MMNSDLNIATIYNSEINASTELRRALLRDQFDEVGYWVEFRPRETRCRVVFRCRHQMSKSKLAELLEMLEFATGRRIPLKKNGFLPVVKDEYEDRYVLDRVCRLGGIHYIYDCKAAFEMDVYCGEEFAKKLAEWLREWHLEKWKWVCIEATKLRDDE